MSVVAVRIKFMPTSPEVDLKKLEMDIARLLSKDKVQNPIFSVEPIAFGLKALIVMFGWPEEKELDTLEAELKEIENVNSVEILDIRRAIG